jgi:predicted phosphodiesterase
MKTFHLISDLHLEFIEEKFWIEPMALIKEICSVPYKSNGHYLIVAGDLCSIERWHLIMQFFDICSPLFEKIFYVTGNHEFYSNKEKTMEELRGHLAVISSMYKNVIYLDNETYDMDGLKIIGSQMWTISQNPSLQQVAQRSMNDFYKIYKNEEGETYNIWPRDVLRYMVRDTGFIIDELKKPGEKLLITHNAPTELAIDKKRYRTSAINESYYYELSHHIIDRDTTAVFGHTHSPFKHKFKNTGWIYSNPYGYNGRDFQGPLSFQL